MYQDWAEIFAGLLDGTSPVYQSKPADDPSSPIGKCSTCGAQFQCTIEEVNSSSET